MEQKKYKLTKETMCFDDVTLHRIQALKDFGDVTASMLDEHHMKFAKPNMPTHWMKMPTHP